MKASKLGIVLRDKHSASTGTITTSRHTQAIKIRLLIQLGSWKS